MCILENIQESDLSQSLYWGAYLVKYQEHKEWYIPAAAFPLPAAVSAKFSLYLTDLMLQKSKFWQAFYTNA